MQGAAPYLAGDWRGALLLIDCCLCARVGAGENERKERKREEVGKEDAT